MKKLHMSEQVTTCEAQSVEKGSLLESSATVSSSSSVSCIGTNSYPEPASSYLRAAGSSRSS